MLLSSDGNRARVLGPKGGMSWYALNTGLGPEKPPEIERPPPKGVEDPEIPCGLDPYYVKYMQQKDPRQAQYYDLLGASCVGNPTPSAGVPRLNDSDVKLAQIESCNEDASAVTMLSKAEGLTSGFAEFFDGGKVATPNPAKFDIRSHIENDIAVNRDIIKELGGKDTLGIEKLQKRAEKEKHLWQTRIEQQEEQRRLERQERGQIYSDAHHGLSVTEVISNSKTATLTKRREDRLKQREDRRQEKLADRGMDKYKARQQQIADSKLAAAVYKTNRPLHLASKAGDLETVQLLVHKTNVDMLGEFGQTCLMLAASGSHVSVIEALLKVPAQMNLQDDDGMTALMWAAAHGSVACVRMLLKWGAAVSITDNEGNMAVDWAFSADPSQVFIFIVFSNILVSRSFHWQTFVEDISMGCQVEASRKARNKKHPDGTPMKHANESPRDRSLKHWQQVLVPREEYVCVDHLGVNTAYRRSMPDYERYPGSGYALDAVATDAERLHTLGQQVAPSLSQEEVDAIAADLARPGLERRQHRLRLANGMAVPSVGFGVSESRRGFDTKLLAWKGRAESELARCAACEAFATWIKEQQTIINGDLCLEVLPVEEVEPAAEAVANAAEWCAEHAWKLQPAEIGKDNAKWVAGDASVAQCDEQKALVVEAMSTVLMLIKLYEEDYDLYTDENSTPSPPEPPGEDPKEVAKRAAMEIIALLEEAAGMKIDLGPAMEARKAKRQAKWGLSSAGGKEKAKELIDISTSAGEKVYNIVASTVKKARMVTRADLEPRLSEDELVELLNLPSKRIAKNKREMVNWLLPRAKACWHDVANAMALHGRQRGTAGEGGTGKRTMAWRKARTGMLTGMMKSTPKMEISLRSAAGKGDLRTVRKLIGEGVDLNAKTSMGWTAYHYAKAHKHETIVAALEAAGCDCTPVPYLSVVERHGATQMNVLRRSVIREELAVSSADVGFLEAGTVAYVTKIVVNSNGTTRGQVDRGWVTIQGLSADNRTRGEVRLEPIKDPNKRRTVERRRADALATVQGRVTEAAAFGRRKKKTAQQTIAFAFSGPAT
eukprot:SAG31_NODE_1947_length_6840_cov_4.654206_3_plen_1059_part_00